VSKVANLKIYRFPLKCLNHSKTIEALFGISSFVKTDLFWGDLPMVEVCAFKNSIAELLWSIFYHKDSFIPCVLKQYK